MILVFKIILFYINFIAAGIWLFYLISFLMGNFNPDSFTIGFSMFLSMLFFVSVITQQKNEKNSGENQTNIAFRLNGE